MRTVRAGGLAVVLALAVVAGALPANSLPSTTYVDKSGGYAITIPTTWKVIPRTQAQSKALIAQLKKKKQTDLANFYAQLTSSDQGRKDMTVYRFQAFDWPGSLTQPIPVEVSVGIVPSKKAYTTKSLPSIGAVFARALAANKGSKVTVPRTVTLPSGPAELIEAIIPIGNGVSNGVELYLIPHGKRLYELSFQIESSQLASAKLFTSIAQLFKFV